MSTLISLPEYLPISTRSPNFHVQRHDLSVVQALAFSDGRHHGFLRLLLRRIRDVQAALHLLFLFGPFDHDAVIQRLNCHHFSP